MYTSFCVILWCIHVYVWLCDVYVYMRDSVMYSVYVWLWCILVVDFVCVCVHLCMFMCWCLCLCLCLPLSLPLRLSHTPSPVPQGAPGRNSSVWESWAEFLLPERDCPFTQEDAAGAIELRCRRETTAHGELWDTSVTLKCLHVNYNYTVKNILGLFPGAKYQSWLCNAPVGSHNAPLLVPTMGTVDSMSFCTINLLRLSAQESRSPWTCEHVTSIHYT